MGIVRLYVGDSIMNILLMLVFISILTLLLISAAIWLISKAIDTFLERDSNLLPDSIEDARPGTILVHSNERGAEYTEVITYNGEMDTPFMEQRAADYLQEDKYTSVEFKDAEGKTYRYDRPKLLQLGWPFPRWLIQ